MPKVLAETLAAEGFRVISGGTDTHVMLIDVFSQGMLGSEAEKALGEAGITVNKNAIPFDTNPPLKPSGVRIGTPALTTRGMKEVGNAAGGPLDLRGIASSQRCRRVLAKNPRASTGTGGGISAISRAARQSSGGDAGVGARTGGDARSFR